MKRGYNTFTMKELFCEDPLMVYIVLGVAAVVLAGLWLTRREGRYLTFLLVPVVLAGGTALLDYFVETDREALERAAREIAADFQVGSIDVALGYVAASYTGFGGDRDDLIAMARSQLNRLDIRKVNLTNFEIHPAGKRAEMKVTSTLHVEGDQPGMYPPLRWHVQWEKCPEVWRIVHVSPPQQVVPGFSG